MKTQFESEKEAQEALDKAKGETLCWCPVIKQDCRKDCGCYYKGTISQGSSPGRFWFAFYPCCTNVLISGEISTI